METSPNNASTFLMQLNNDCRLNAAKCKYVATGNAMKFNKST